MDTRQVILQGPRQAVVLPTRLRPLHDGEVLLRVTQGGLCSTEVHQWLGHASAYPLAVGHEIAGVVEEARGDTGALNVGDHAVGWIPGGGMAERVITQSAHVLRVPADLPYPAIAEPLACCENAVELVNPPRGANIAIIGTGFIGHIIQHLSQLRGARNVIVAGRRTSALDRARAAGTTHTIDLRTQDLSAAIAAATGGTGADVVYEATGTQQGLAVAELATSINGTLAIVGYHQDGLRTVDLELWNRRALRIANAHFRDLTTIMDGMRRGMQLVQSGALDVARLYTHRFSLDEAPVAFELASRRPEGFTKALIEPVPRENSGSRRTS